MPSVYPTIESFNPIPLKDVIKSYKALAKSLTQFEKLTEKQHQLARYYGFKDWQSFQSHIKSLYDEISEIDLSNKKWTYVFNVYDGLFIESNGIRVSLL